MFDALEHLHNIGFIHHDIKPENILTGSCDKDSTESREFHLIDFGIARRYMNS